MQGHLQVCCVSTSQVISVLYTMASKQSIGEDAFRTIIPKLASQLQIDTDSLLANKLFSENLISSKKREHILASTEKKVEYLMVALQTEIEEDDSMVDKTIQVLKSLQGYEAIGCQLEGTTLSNTLYHLTCKLCI